MTHPRHTRRIVALALAVSLPLGGTACSSCKRHEEQPIETKPPDHLAPNEAVESKERAFGLPLPRNSRIVARFDKTIHVQTLLTPEDLVNFVRARVKDGRVMPGTTSTELSGVAPVGAPDKRLSIEVRLYRGGEGHRSEMLVFDTTPPPAEPGLTDEQRWQKAGLTPSGHVADPTKLQ